MRKEWKHMRRWFLIIVLIILIPQAGYAEPVISADRPTEVPIETKYIALTFDDGPKAGTTDRLLDGLKERGASATFFLVGEWAAINQDLVRRMQEEGHQIGNHTWSHVRLEGTDTEELLEEIEKNENLLQEILGGENYWLRPPYGMIDEELEDQIHVPMMKWSIDPRDWESRDQEKIVTAILKEATPNSIVLLHDIYPASVDAALEVVYILQKQGYWFVTVEELLYLNGIQPQNGRMYRLGE
jgi:peptidoglycan/xylan/chitin deacetylase (PgdA/CDA1 family)